MPTDSPEPKARGPQKRARGRLSIKEVEAALRGNGGVQANAAKALGVSRSTICLFVRKHPKLQFVIDEVVAEWSDMAESQLYLAIGRGEAWAVKMQLERGGQDRGFGMRKLAFRDGEGNVALPAMLVVDHRMTPDDWEAKYGAKEAPVVPTSSND